MSKITGPLRGKGGFPALGVWLLQALVLWALHGAAWAQDPKIPRIGVLTNASIGAFGTALEGFEAALADAGFKDGVSILYDRQNFAGDLEKANTMVRKFRTDRVALIHSLGTPATQAVTKSTPNIPVVFSAVRDPAGAGIVPATSAPGQPTGTNVTGISDRWPVRLQMETYARLVPQKKKWGTIYDPADPGAAFNVATMRAAARQLGLELVEVTVASGHEAGPAAQSLVGKVQVVYLPADNTVGAEYRKIAEILERNGIAFFTGTSTSLSRGALAAIGVDYFLAGYAAGKQASLVLKGVSAGSIPWDLAENFGLIINQKAARSLGIRIPADMLKIADKVLE